MNMSQTINLGARHEVEPVKFGDFLFSGKRVYSKRKQHFPEIEEFKDIIETDDHSIPLEELVARLDTDLEKGLTHEQVILIRERYGDNVVSDPNQNMLHDVFGYFRGSYFILCAGIIFCFITAFEPNTQLPPPYTLNHLYLGLVMIIMIAISVCVSAWQERNAFSTLKLMNEAYPQYASVIRNGQKVIIHKNEVVVGDLVLLKAGSDIPADVRITEACNLKVDEVPLTYDSEPASKSPECTSKNLVASENVAFYGTMCVEGYGQGIAINTGDYTVYGKIIKKKAVFQKMNIRIYEEVRSILRGIGVFTLSVGVVVFVIKQVLKYYWVGIVAVIIAQLITSMPDILYSFITASLDCTTRRIVSKHCLPKNYEALQKLGSISAICCDKTGTITQNRMTVVHLWLDGKAINVDASEDRNEMHLRPSPAEDVWYVFTRAASLCQTIASKSRRNRCIIKKGCSCDQSEVAIMEFINYTTRKDLATGRIDDFRQKYKKVFEIPYNSYKKYHVTIYDTNHLVNEECSFLLCMKGAVEEILKVCSTVLLHGRNYPLSKLDDLNFQEIFLDLMENGERIIGFCDQEIPKDQYGHGHKFEESDVPLTGLRFLGFVSLMDPPKPSVPEAIKKCREAGIRVILTTEDHPVTSKAIARQVGIISSRSKTKKEIMEKFSISAEEVTPQTAKATIVTGSELEEMEKQEVYDLLDEHKEIVFARINAKQKVKIVECLREVGEVVAVTGNSFEDTLAMRKANIGIGMGTHGADVCRKVADVILLGDNFDSIVMAIEEGKNIYKNLRKAMVYVLSSNVPELSPLFIVGILHTPFTMGPDFMLFITLIAETFPVLYISQDESYVHILANKSLKCNTFFDRRIIHKSYFQVGVIGVLNGMFMYFLIMAEHGFMPKHVYGIAPPWNSPAVNDLVDSFNQEWDYPARKSLEYTCQTAFFLSIFFLQFVHFVVIRTRIYGRICSFRFRFIVTSITICIYQIWIILFLMYIPGLSKAFHFYPLKIRDWVLCLPFPFVYVFYEELRRYLLRHSPKDSWLQTETI